MRSPFYTETYQHYLTMPIKMIVAEREVNMYELVEVRDNEVFTTSKIIAEGTGNKHSSVQAIIQKYAENIEKFGSLDFSDFKSEKRGRPEKIYYLNEQQATFLMTLMRNDGVHGIVVEFKKRLVEEFFRMREYIRQKQSDEWEKTRIASKENMLKETDVIKLLAEYAEEQGSKNPDKLYMVYTKLAKTVTSGNRDDMSITDLNNITLTENIILQTIRIDMAMGMHYKDIYKDCKERIERFAEIAYLNGNKNRKKLATT